MKKLSLKSLTLAVSIMLVLSVCLIGATFNTVAVETEYTVATTTGSTSDAIDSANNKINGKTPTEFSIVTELTNGVNSQRALTSAKTLSFEFDTFIQIDEVIVISQNQSTSASRLGKYEIYAANYIEDLYNAENKIAEIAPESVTAGWRTYVDTFTFVEGKKATAKYIGFNILERNITDASGTAYINELIVKGVENVPSYTVRTTTGSTSDTIDTASNKINGKTPLEFSAVTELTNGLNEARALSSATHLSFDFGTYIKIQDVTVISQNGYASAISRLGKYEIYAANDADSLYNEGNKIAEIDPAVPSDSGWRTYVDTFTFIEGKEVTARYIGFNIIARSISNATGTAAINEIMVKGVENVPDLTITTTTGSTSDTIDSDGNLILNKAPIEFAAVVELTDGLPTQRSLGTVETLSFAFEAPVKVSEVVVRSQSQSSTSTRLGKYEIYIADTLETLYNSENVVATIDPADPGEGWHTYIDTFSFSDKAAKTGKYIGFNILERNITDADGNAYINEIQVKGTKFNAVTATAGNGGTIATTDGTAYDDVTNTFEAGATAVYTITANQGYKVADVFVNEQLAEVIDGKVTIENISGAYTIEATFVKIGDVNNDGNIDSLDIKALAMHILGIEGAELDTNLANANGIDGVDICDMVYVSELIG